MSSTDSLDTAFIETSADAPAHTPVVTNLLTRALAASLLIGTSHTFASPDSWKVDKYVIPGEKKILGVGDIFMVHREIHTTSIGTLSMPVFVARLSHIVAWGHTHIEFGIENLNTGYPHQKTIKLPFSVIRLSILQRLRKLVFPFPRCPDPLPNPPRPLLPIHHKPAGNVGDCAPRDSDGLPIWNRR
ncbi:hypothetical protein DEU56DRAFT_912408 [Suillus clintonianus]|uniref:uncharacterized protein n=1 Tax=Suillus clintonianus TaxID=1904413 RepID=UPI001B86DE0E|nr:uncharacterized protein DEU56DRAFT_912408 [Suillus clintonianus]KAG2138543.1 hypothetical protein DEU56DRAFT_912408 [Suillus clintonianus]